LTGRATALREKELACEARKGKGIENEAERNGGGETKIKIGIDEVVMFESNPI